MKNLSLPLLASLIFMTVVFWPNTVQDTLPSVTGFEGDPEESLYLASLTKAPLGMIGVQFFESVEGKRRWNIRSKFAELHRRDNYTFMKGVNADFYANSTGNVVYTKSNYGRSQLDKQLVVLDGSVMIHSRRGYVFEMDHLNYDGSTHEFSTANKVIMSGPDPAKPIMRLQGIGMQGNIDAERFFLKSKVNAQRILKTSETLKITSRSGEFFTESQRAIFSGNVKSLMSKVAIDSDSMELSLLNGMESLKANGNVILRQKQSVGRAASAYVEIGSGKIVLEGQARVDSKDNELQGQRIIIYSDEDRIEVEKAKGRITQ